MEDTLRVKHGSRKKIQLHCLNPCFNGRYSQSTLLYLKHEVISLNPCFNGRYSQRKKFGSKIQKNYCLNPCFNGRYSQRTSKPYVVVSETSLNPCFNGRYSQSALERIEMALFRVLILVLMEDTLRDVGLEFRQYSRLVLILVLMEDTLRAAF
mgnify:CR=1 FL=1